MRWTEESLAAAKTMNDSRQVKERQERLYVLAPRKKPSPSEDDFLEVAYDYRRAREFQPSRHYYRKVIRSNQFSFPDRVRAYHGFRMTYKNERDLDSYLDATEELGRFVEYWFKKNPSSFMLRSSLHDTLVTLARTYWTLDHYSKGYKTLDKLERHLKGRHSLHKVYWLTGRMREERGHYKEAVSWFNQSLQEFGDHSEAREEVLWFKAWNQRKLGNKDSALDALSELKLKTTSDYARAKFSFWLAKTFQDMGDEVRAHMEFEDLIRQDPLGYYGLLAHHEIGRRITFKSEAVDR